MKKRLVLIAIIFFAILLFLPTLSYYFTQDDFFHFKMSQAGDFGEFLDFFSFRNKYGYQFYRPLTTQVFLFAGRRIFDLNPLGFRLASLSVFLINVFLVHQLVSKITQSECAGLWSAFFYGVSSAHFTSLAYLSAFEEIGVAFFYFLTLLLYLKRKKLSFLIFILALMCRETAVTLPFVIAFLEFLREKKYVKLTPFLLILSLYFILKLEAGMPEISAYRITVSPPKIINSLFWYTFWSAGAPESLVDFAGPGFKINPRFLTIFGWEGRLIIVGAILVLLFIGCSTIKLLLSGLKSQRKNSVVFLGLFLIPLMPFLFLPQHKFAYYLEVPLLGFCGLASLSIFKVRKLWLWITVGLFVGTSILTVNFYKDNYWVAGRSRLTKRLAVELKKTYRTLPRDATIFFKNDPEAGFVSKEWGGTSTQAYYALSGENGPQVIYNDYSLKAYYEDIFLPPAGTRYFSFTAKSF